MKVYVNKQNPERTYPYTAVYETSGAVVLFTGPGRGILLKGTWSGSKVTGEPETGWAEGSFTPCTVTITNE